MKKILLPALLTLSIFLSKTTLAQVVVNPPADRSIFGKPPGAYQNISINGRILGVNLENVVSASVINICTGENVVADSHGIYHITASKGDTLVFVTPKYSTDIIGIKSTKGVLNVVMIKRKADNLPSGYSKAEYNKAAKEDDELLRILQKDAKLEGKWNY